MIKRRSKPRRVSVARDPKYLEFLRSEGLCAVCICRPIGQPIDAAHASVNGMGSKGSDLLAVPLCRDHHRLEHTMGAKVFWAEFGINRSEIVKFWNQRYKEMPA